MSAETEHPSYDVHVDTFSALDAAAAYRLWALRESVFVVEQDCPYQELEPGTRHVWLDSPTGPVGYLRILDDVSAEKIGRVLVAPSHRGLGLSGALMRAALAEIGDRPSVLDAQSPLVGWYATFGYRQDGAEFVEDGIPHTPMRRDA